MNILFIDTHCSRNFSVGLQSAGLLEILHGADAATELITKVEQLTRNLESKKLDQIIIITGPGSLTGLRIGASFALGLALGMSAEIKALTIWDLLLANDSESDIFFYTGTKKWIHKNKNIEEIVEFADIKSQSLHCVSNNPEKMPAGVSLLPYPNIINLMVQFSGLASNNLDLLYNISVY